MKVSVIIPLSSDETEHKSLLNSLPDNLEIILSKENSRATSLNSGAKKATGEYLWFLHADSQLSDNTIDSLLKTIKQHPYSLIYFDLAFKNDASKLMVINTIGVKFRSNILGMPFGDQGFCIQKKLFEQIGGFPENAPYGEDHLFVWKARQQGIKLHGAGTKIYTSARKYKKNGWLKITLKHLYLCLIQAVPEYIKLLKTKKTS